MKNIVCYSLLLGLSVFMGCQNQEDWKECEFDETVRLNVQIESPENSRTAVNDANQVIWLESDKIGVYGSQGTDNAAFMPEMISNEGRTATFVGVLKNGETPAVVYYPYNETTTVSGEKLTLTFPSEYDYTENSNAPMIGVMQDDGTFRFNHLCGLLRISVLGIPEGIMTFKVTSNGENAPAIAGNAIVQNINQYGTELTINADQSKEISITYNADVISNKVCLIPLPAGEYPQLSVSLQDEDSVYFDKTIVDCVIKRATILNMPEISIIPDYYLSVDEKSNQLILFDYKNNAIAFYGLKENGLPEYIRIWNAEESSEEGYWTEIAFYEDGTIKSITYDANQMIVFDNYRENLVDMACVANNGIVVYKDVVCSNINWGKYIQNIALAEEEVEETDDFDTMASYFVTLYSQEISGALISLTQVTSVYVSEMETICTYADDWDSYWEEIRDTEIGDLKKELDTIFELFKSKEEVFDELEEFDTYADFKQEYIDYIEQIEEMVAHFIEMALEELNKQAETEEDTPNGVIEVPPFEQEEW